MTLLEILVRELPKRGGWPDGIEHLEQYTDGSLFCGPKYQSDFKFPRVDDYGYDLVTREQYEAACLLCKQLPSEDVPIWNGEGLPPVGCDCEYQDSNTNKWYPVTIQYVSDQLIVICGVTNILGEEQKTEIAKDIICDKPQFRHIRSEADKKKEAAIKAIDDAQSQVFDQELTFSQYLYDAIAAGKIPHIRID